jgi:hypothetical protein
MPIPEVFLNKPQLMLGLEFYYMAFWDLVSDRLAGSNGAGMILYSAISTWAKDHNIHNPDELDRLKYIIHNIDMAYLNYYRPKEK